MINGWNGWRRTRDEVEYSSDGTRIGLVGSPLQRPGVFQRFGARNQRGSVPSERELAIGFRGRLLSVTLQCMGFLNLVTARLEVEGRHPPTLNLAIYLEHSCSNYSQIPLGQPGKKS
jgi:hypothetical protein